MILYDIMMFLIHTLSFDSLQYMEMTFSSRIFNIYTHVTKKLMQEERKGED